MPAPSKMRLPPWTALPSAVPSLLRDLPVILGAFGAFYGLISLARYWTAPLNTQAEIHLGPGALPMYALFSVARIMVALCLSLAFALFYGYTAAHYSRAERYMIPLLDTLQSIPVLCFLPGVMISMVALFPTCEAIWASNSDRSFWIFTGQVWNMAFSIYSSP